MTKNKFTERLIGAFAVAVVVASYAGVLAGQVPGGIPTTSLAVPTDADDNSIAYGQTVGRNAALLYCADATTGAWIRCALPTDWTEGITPANQAPGLMGISSTVLPSAVSSGLPKKVWFGPNGQMVTRSDMCGNPDFQQSIALNVSSAGNSQLVGLTAGQIIYVCGYDFMSAGTVNVSFVYGTGSNCGTGETALTGAYPLVAQSGNNVPVTGFPQFWNSAGTALCIKLSGAISVQGVFKYVKR